MKKYLPIILSIIALSGTAFAATGLQIIGNNWKTGQDATTAASKTITVNMSLVTGKRIVIDSIAAATNKTNSMIQIQNSTNNVTYARKGSLTCGSGTQHYGYASEKPLFIGLPGYYYRVLLDCGSASTTTNTLIVNYHEE